MNASTNSFNTQDQLNIDGKEYQFFNLKKLEQDISKLPFSIKILLENLLRNEDNLAVTKTDIEAILNWKPNLENPAEIAFTPARVILQDFTGVPAVADLASMRDAMSELGGDPSKINPLIPSELVIDHSVQVDVFANPNAVEENAKNEFERNQERYSFLKWGQTAFNNFKVVPPDTGIVHQVNIEYLARVIFDQDQTLYPDTLVGTDSHTTMVNGLGVLGWGVGGIEAEAAMLGQPITMLIPQVIGVKLTGKLPTGITATDLVLTITQTLREVGVVGKFVEFFGEGLSALSLADRATLSNMSPEFGSTCAIFPIDEKTLDYLKLTGRDEKQIKIVEEYAKAQGLFVNPKDPDADYTQVVEVNLNDIVPSISGPKRPQDRVILTEAKTDFEKVMTNFKASGKSVEVEYNSQKFDLKDGAVVIAAITSCTNTSNPSVLMAAGLLARKAHQKGLASKPWVKTSLAPGSQVVTDYLEKAELLPDLEKLGFHVVGYGCTTCIGNSGPLPDPIAEAISKNDLLAVSTLSGNRNFEGRINPHVKANYLMSPPLVVAYALSGKMDWDPENEALGQDQNGNDIFLKDIWPSADEIAAEVAKIESTMFASRYGSVFKGPKLWQDVQSPSGDKFSWEESSTYIQRPSFFSNMEKTPSALTDINEARVLVMLGDSVTTDHISPAGSISKNSPAAKYLQERNIDAKDFNSYGSRRGNHEVMVRGTFGNIRLRNELAPGTEGGVTRYLPSNEQTSIFEASMKYQSENTPLIALAGAEYGSGSSRDWAAKGTFMLGIKAVIAKSYERIHRSNLIGMGVLPLEFTNGETKESLGLTGEEFFSISGIADDLSPNKKLQVIAKSSDGSEKTFTALARIDTPVELEYYKHGGILQYVLRQLLD